MSLKGWHQYKAVLFPAALSIVMKKMVGYIVTSLVLAGYASCKKPFSPNLTTVTTNFLAVDGPILSGDSTIISLSRTTSLSDTTQNKVELKAIVSVEDDQAKLYPLVELGKGKYALGVTNFDPTRKYRLDIKTSNGKIYQSDFVPMKVTPPIDSIYFKQNSHATVLFYVNAHDATNSTRYYRWDYKETWSYVALYPSFYHYSNGLIYETVPDSPDDIWVCYRKAPSNQIFVGSSANLAKDVISNQLLGGLANNVEKLGHVYVMQLRQYALTLDGFNYYQNLKTNTEQLGSIFDSQPTTLNGNIHCITSPADLVIGFVSASTVTSKQFNLHNNDIQLRAADLYGITPWLNLPAVPAIRYYSAYYFPPPDTTSCGWNFLQPIGVTIPGDVNSPAVLSPAQIRILSKGDSLVMDRLLPPFYYYYAPKNCVYCRTKGGTNIRPSYFPYPAY